jgi:hypothetical protein
MTATLHVGASAIVHEAGDWGRTNETLPVPPVCAKTMISREITAAAPDTAAVQVDVKPTAPGVQETETEVTPCVTAKLAVPELAALPESPGYDAWIVTEPGVVPRTDIEQLVPEMVHVAGEGSATAPAPVAEKAIFSPEIVPEAPDTVAVHCAIAFTAMETWEQDTEVVVPDAGEYWKAVTAVEVPPAPPRVMFTVYFPTVQHGLPPPQDIGPPAWAGVRTGAANTPTANTAITKSAAIRKALLKKAFFRLLTKSR